MFRVLNSNKPLVLFFIPIVGVIFLLPGLASMRITRDVDFMPFYQLIQYSLKGLPVLSFILVVLAVLLATYLLNYYVNRHQLLYKNTNLTATTFIIILAFVSPFLNPNPIVFANILMILALNSVLTIYNQLNVYVHCFRIGFLIGLATHFYLLSIFFIPVFIVALVIIRTFNWRDYVITLLGFIVPFLYCWTYYFWNDNLGEYYASFKLMKATVIFDMGSMGYLKYFFLVIGLLSIYAGINKLGRENVRQKNLLYILFAYVGIFSITSFFFKISYINLMILVSVPMAVLIAIFLQSIRRSWLVELTVWTILAMAASNYQLLF